MLCIVGITTAAAADYSGFYRFKGPRSTRYVYDDGSNMKVGTKSTITKGNLSEIWEVRAIEGDAYVIINAGTGHMVMAQTATQREHATSATTCSPFYIKKNGTKYVISCNDGFSGYSCWHEDSSNRIVVWNDTETYSQWAFTTVTGEDLAAAQEAVASYGATLTKAITDATKMNVLQTGGVFRLKSRYDHYATENTSTHAVSGATTKKVNDLNQIWIIEKTTAGYTIRNANSGRYLPDTGGADAALITTDAAKTYYIKTSAYSSDYYTISWKSDYANGTCLHENSSAKVVKWNANNSSNTNMYSDWSIVPVDEADTEATVENLRIHIAQQQGIATEVTTGTYRMVSAAYPNLALTETADNNIGGLAQTNRYSQVWRITTSANGTTCTMQNVLTEHYVKNNATTSNAFKTQTSGASNVNFTIGTGGGKFDSFFNFRGSNTGFHCAQSASYGIVGWDANDPASQWILYPVDVDDDALAAERQEVEQAAELQNNAATYNEKLQKYFEDYACTELRSAYITMSDEELCAAMAEDGLPELMQTMAVCVKSNTWAKGKTTKYNDFVHKFRIQDVQCYSDNSVWGEITKTGPFGELTSPTGIQGKTGEYVYIYVDDDAKADANIRALLAYDTEYRNKGELALHKGINVWQLPADGEVFINYVCTNSERMLDEFPAIRVHIEGATVNGYWDLSRNMTNADWSWLKSNMFKGEFLHVKGNNVVLNVLTANVKGATKPVEIMKGWDFAFLGLQKAIGNTGQWDGRYNPVVNPRHSYSGNPNWGGYGGSNHTSISKDYLFNYDNFYANNIWEILHEIGHGCQGPIKMAGTTEVTNNSLAQIVSHMMGNNYSRGNGTDRLVQMFNYEHDGKRGWSWVDYVRYATPFYDSSLHTGNHLLYQLYLYFEVMGHNPGFLTRLMNEMRANPITYSGKDKVNGTPVTYNDDFWKFARACAKASETDLWEFFEAYGFWKYADEIISTSSDDPATTSAAYKNGNRFIGDYGNYSMKLPVRNNATDEANLAELREFMKSQPHAAPNVLFLDDKAETCYVDPESFVAQINSTRAGKELAQYWTITSYPDYGQYTNFDGVERAEGIMYTIGTSNYTQSFKTDKGGEWDYTTSGRKVTMSGTGILGVKIYDADGKLCWLANTKTFVIPTDMAEAIKNGEYKVAIAVTADKDVILAPGEEYTNNTTGISNLTADDFKAGIYDLQGRRAARQSHNGLLIEGGKKVLR